VYRCFSGIIKNKFDDPGHLHNPNQTEDDNLAALATFWTNEGNPRSINHLRNMIILYPDLANAAVGIVSRAPSLVLEV
jgi:hypothetical protein